MKVAGVSLPGVSLPGLSLPRLLPTPGSFERMSGLDATFLHAETDRTPLHIGALAIFEGGPFFEEGGVFRLEAVQARVTERLHLFPRLRQRACMIPFRQGRPVWVDDEHFDIDRHVTYLELAAPGSREQLAELAALLHMRLLDRDRPLWELVFVGGLDDGNVAMVEKVHHAVVDGVSGVDVAAALLDLEPEPPIVEVPPWEPVPAPPEPQLLAESLRERVLQPGDWLRAVLELVPSPGAVTRLAGGVFDAAATLLQRPTEPHRTSLHQRVGVRRRFAWVTVSFDDVRTTAHDMDAKVNDVVLAAVAGSLRTLFEHRGEPTQGRRLQALVPVSIRADDEHHDLGNRVSAMLAPLLIGEADPRVRLAAIRDAMVRHKEHHQADGAELLLDTIELLPPGILAAASRLIHSQPLVDVVVTNVPGPPVPLYFMGARMLESAPIVPLGGNLTIGIAILSYAGSLTVGLFGDGDAFADLDVLRDALATEFAALTGSAPSTGS